jgi:hypothetical protein
MRFGVPGWRTWDKRLSASFDDHDRAGLRLAIDSTDLEGVCVSPAHHAGPETAVPLGGMYTRGQVLAAVGLGLSRFLVLRGRQVRLEAAGGRG